ncbi:MAG: transporter substrate-binding domain-containing protein [Pseudomonadota bacterium]
MTLEARVAKPGMAETRRTAILTDTQCRTAKAKDKPYKLTDANGLYLEVKPSDVKAWRYRFELRNAGIAKESTFAPGNYATKPLGETPEEAQARRAGRRFALAEARNERAKARDVLRRNRRLLMNIRSLALVFSIFAMTAVQAQSLNILTEEDPPYSFTKDGSPTGFGVEVTREIQKRIGSTDAIKIQPWARVYRTVSEEPNTVAFAMSRTKEREHLFQWVGPIVENDWVLVGKKNAGIKISTLEDAMKLDRIGTVRDYAWTKFLTDKGFNNLDQITERKQNTLKLQADRIKAFVSADSSYKSEILENKLNPNDFEILFRMNTVQMYLALSKNTNKETVKKWQAALDAMKNDGTFLTLQKKWLPDNKLPGTAKPADF